MHLFFIFACTQFLQAIIVIYENNVGDLFVPNCHNFHFVSFHYDMDWTIILFVIHLDDPDLQRDFNEIQIYNQNTKI